MENILKVYQYLEIKINQQLRSFFGFILNINNCPVTFQKLIRK